MMPRRHAIRLALWGAVCLGVAACGEDGTAGGREAPNPAVFCAEQGGRYLLESGQCRLEDGSLVDAWEHYRARSAADDVR